MGTARRSCAPPAADARARRQSRRYRRATGLPRSCRRRNVPSAAHHRPQPLWIIRHDTVNTAFDERAHPRVRIHRPSVHPEVALVGRLAQVGRDHVPARVDRMRAHRNRVHHQVNRLLFGKQADANVEMELLNFFQIFPIEARHDAIAERVARLHDLRDLMLEATSFELDIEPAPAAGDGEHFVERGNSLARERATLELRARVQALELLERQFRDLALAVRRALDSLVMNYDDAAVAAELNVEFAHVRTCVDSGAKRAQGVLGKSTARPAMGYVQHSPLPPPWNN